MKWEHLGAAIVSTDGPFRYLISPQRLDTRDGEYSMWQAWRLQSPSSIDIGCYASPMIAQEAAEADTRRLMDMAPQ